MPADAPSPATEFDPARAAELLSRFYALHPDDGDPYLAGKQRLSNGRRELVSAWAKVRPALAGARVVLDWGCRHGVFARLAREELGEAAELHGCDLCPPEQYAAMHAAIGLRYQALSHPWQLPYADGSHDVVLAGGTLEHVANDGQSLTELWRVLRPGGRLIVTHLPNAGSISEWWSRRFAPAQAHLRRYRPAAMRRRLLQHGFLTTAWGWHQWLPSTLSGAEEQPVLSRWLERIHPLNAVLERLWPLNHLATTLWFTAEKRTGF